MNIIGGLIIVFMLVLIALVTWDLFKVTKWQDVEEDEDPGDTNEWEYDIADDLADSLLNEVFTEWKTARAKFGPFHSSHEGFAVLHEEFDELKTEVWKNGEKHPDREAQMRKEAVQVAAMALRFLTDCCEHSERKL